ncbi:hypothetical protein [Vulcanisaeta souniana]|nr:hypothetical protein [Vulcanisaeta souniana]GGI83756.1 hypothetical protein GCM10007112_20670 [Vulcanisaeta souniana JCM 11219]
MRLYQLGILLILLAVIIPIITITIIIAIGIPSTRTALTNVGGAIIVFPLIPIPIIFTFGKPQITQPLIWLAYVMFIIFLALIIFSVVQFYRARREYMRQWQDKNK